MFKVTLHSNTIHKPHQLDKHKGLLEAAGRANNRTLWEAGKWSFGVTKFVDDLPSTIFVGDEYLDDRNPHKHFKKVVPDEIPMAPKNFDIWSKATVLSYD